MAGCSGLDCGQGKSAREEANLWSSSLKDLLTSCEGRSKFKDFLDENGMEDEKKTVEFWEECNDIVTEHKKLKNDDPDGTAKLISHARKVISLYVDSREINLDEGQIKHLKDSVESDIPEKIGDLAKSFEKARESAVMLLKDVHTFFANHLHEIHKI